MDNPKVTIITPTYNDSDTIFRTVKSVINQSYKNWELIIVDDSSTDGTEYELDSMNDDRIEYIKHRTNKGASAARNTGIERSTGELIAFLDADDRWSPEKTQKQVREITSEQDTVGVVSDSKEIGGGNSYQVIRIASRILNWSRSNYNKSGGEEVINSIFEGQLHANAGSTLMADAETVNSIGGFDEAFNREQDIEFLVRLAKQGQIEFIDEKLAEVDKGGKGPTPDMIEQESERLINKYHKEISASKVPIDRVWTQHHLKVAKSAFSYGRWSKGKYHLEKADLSPEDYLGIFYSIFKGVKGKWQVP